MGEFSNWIMLGLGDGAYRAYEAYGTYGPKSCNEKLSRATGLYVSKLKNSLMPDKSDKPADSQASPAMRDA